MANVSYKLWLNKAKEDLIWINASLKASVWYGACFASQQAAEKALKAYLSRAGKEPPKIHGLVALLEECLKFNTGFEELREGCSALTVYYAPTRYVDLGEEFISFSETQGREAYRFAKEIIKFVENKLNHPIV